MTTQILMREISMLRMSMGHGTEWSLKQEVYMIPLSQECGGCMCDLSIDDAVMNPIEIAEFGGAGDALQQQMQ